MQLESYRSEKMDSTAVKGEEQGGKKESTASRKLWEFFLRQTSLGGAKTGMTHHQDGNLCGKGKKDGYSECEVP